MLSCYAYLQLNSTPLTSGTFFLLLLFLFLPVNTRRNGRWRSEWKIPVGKSGNLALSGRIRVQVHYYEEGNVQLQTDTSKKTTAAAASVFHYTDHLNLINIQDPATTAVNAVKAIVKVEQAFHQALDTSYTTMGETSFKALRRALPITHQKINWNLIRGYKMGQQVGRIF